MPHLQRLTPAIAVGSLAGCAQRGAISGPQGDPGAGTWAAVWIAAALAVAVAGALLTLADNRDRGGPPLSAVVLGLQAGAAFVGTAVLIGAALRSRDLFDREPDAEMADSLLRLSGLDGDRDLFGLIVVLVLVGGVLLTGLLALAARFALGDDVIERFIACGILAVEVGACALAFGRFALGHRGWPYLAATAALPVLVAALVTGWPSRRSQTVRPRPC